MLKLDGNAFKFDLRIDQGTIDRGRAHGKGLVTSLQEHLRRRLSHKLGRVPEFFFVLEHRVTGEPEAREHLHGIVGLRPGEEARAKAAIASLGKFYKSKRLVMKALKCPYMCANYAAKDERYVRVAEGRSPLYISRALCRRSRAVYELALQRYNELVKEAERERMLVRGAEAA